MAREIPEVVRAAAGLAATLFDEASKLPETLPGLPVRIIGMAMQHAMKIQQQYAGLVARGDELFTGLRGEDEPGLATFDDEVPAPTGGFRDSAFDRAGDTFTAEAAIDVELSEVEVGELLDDAEAEAIVAEVVELAEQVEDAQQTLEMLAEEAPSAEEVLDELAIEEMVAEVPATAAETAPATESAPAAEPAAEKPAKKSGAKKSGKKAAAKKSAAATEAAPAGTPDATPAATPAETPDTTPAPATPEPAPEAPAAETSDETPDATPDATPAPATPEPAPEAPAAEPTPEAETTPEPAAASEAPSTTPAPSTETAPSTAPATAPIDGYDDWSVAQLRGRLRGYALSTVQDLVAYEEATKARAPYLTMLRNRLEKVEEQAVASSPLAPRGA